MKIKLVDDWKDFYKWYSTHISIIAGAVSLVYADMYDKLSQSLPPKLMIVLLGIVFFLKILLSVISQDVKNEPVANS